MIFEKLESIEIRPKEKIFKVNGEDFVKGCRSFEISIMTDPKTKEFVVRFETQTTVVYEYFDSLSGKKKEERSRVLDKNDLPQFK